MIERNLRTKLSDEDMERADAYAKANGLLMPRAYGELIQAGLDAELEGQDPTTDTEDHSEG